MMKNVFLFLLTFCLFNSLVEAQDVVFPLRGSKHDELGDHRRMKTDITISASGRIDGTTRTWTAKHWKGFTGTVVVYITDSSGNILYSTNPQSYGVNGLYMPGAHDRNVVWTNQIPVDSLSKVAGYVIHQVYDPRNKLTVEAVKEMWQLFTN